MTEEQKKGKKERWQKWYQKNKNTDKQVQRRKRKSRKHWLKSKYNISPSQWDTLFVFQNKRCAICKTDTPSGKTGWCIDHCHKTNKVRGILCHNCNVGIGNLHDDILILEEAVRYLKVSRG